MKKTLNVWLKKNLLTEDPNDFAALIQSRGSVVIADIVAELVDEGMEIKRETVIDIISRFNRKAADLVLSGYNVNTGLVYMRPIVKGVFHDKVWSAEANPVYITINQGLDLRNAVTETTVEILGELADPMEIYSLTDTTTGKNDGTLTKGRNAELKGSYLKIAGDHPDCGVSFRNTATQIVTKLVPGDIVLNEPSRLLILVPSTLEAGEYELMVTTQYTSGNIKLNAPRSMILGIPVVIV